MLRCCCHNFNVKLFTFTVQQLRMSASVYFTNITKYFQQYADLVSTLNSFGFTDEAVHAENLFAEILNTIFGWNLKNANELKRNQSSFDLIDLKNHIYVQVTTNKKHKPKFEKATNSFKIKAGQNVETKFIVLFISKKINKSILDGKHENGIDFEGYDIPKLLSAILYNLPTPTMLKKLNNLLESAIAPVLLTSSVTRVSKAKVSIQKEVAIGIGLYIKRENLMIDLLKFCKGDNGLLIGGPGFGKSFVINELQRICHSQKTPCYIIRINELTEGSDAEISSELKCPIDWLETLKIMMEKNATTGILVFDAFDTAKDEKLKATIYKQISKAIEILNGKWNVLVSARTYDAAKSTLLQNIFPHSTYKHVISCRNFEIPELDDNELTNAISQNPILKSTIDKSSAELQKLIKTPYFLKLVEQIITDNDANGETLSGIETEAQLLDVFWRKKIEDSTEKVLFIQKLTKLLASNSSLIIERDKILNELNVVIFDNLVSLHIIEESGSGSYVSFTHNILLDFAIAKYLMKNSATEQIKFLDENNKIPFIFRQSFIYFYGQLYKNNNDIFWKHYNEIRKIDTPTFRLFHQTIMNYILVSYYNSPAEILPNLISDSSEVQANIRRKALESIRFITKGNLRPYDIDLLLAISAEMNYLLVWEVGNLIDKGIGIYRNENDTMQLKKLAVASCNYLEFMLKEKDSKEGELIIRNTRFWAIANVSNTFSFNKTKAKSLLKRVLLMLSEPDYDIFIFQTLATNLLPIIKADSDFGMQIYKTLYLHNEKNNDVTNWGGGVVNLRSNRKQDFGHIYWELEQKYAEYLKLDFAVAMPVAVEIVNKYSKEKRLSYQKESFKMVVGRVKSLIAFDYDHYEVDDKNGEYTHIKKIFDHLEALVLKSKSVKNITADLYLFIGKIEAGKLWRWLLNYLVKHPKHFKKISFEILSNLAIYENDDTLHEAGELIKSTWSYFSLKERIKIEILIHSLKESLILHPELVNRRISRLLNCIPKNEFSIPESQIFVTEHDKVENALIVEQNHTIMAEARYHSAEEKILYAGFDLKIRKDSEVFKHYDAIEKFNSRFENKENKSQLKGEYKSAIPSAIYLFEKVKSKSFRNEQINKSCDFELSRTTRIVSSIGKKLLKKEQQFIESVALFYIADLAYQPSEYESGKMNNRLGGANGPMARSGSVLTLQNLLYDFSNENALKALCDCMADNSAFIRYRALYILNYLWKFKHESFWKLYNTRLAIESDGACFGRLIDCIHHEAIIAADLLNVKEACDKIALRLREADDETIRDNWRLLIHAILKIIYRHDKDWAFEYILKNIDIKEFSRNLVFEIRSSLNNFNPKDDFTEILEKANVVFDILMEILKFRFKKIQANCTLSIDMQDDFEIIDHVIQNLFFAFDHEGGNEKGRKLSDWEKEVFYRKIKSLIEFAANESSNIENGFMVLHTGYYFMLLLNILLPIDPANILKISNTVALAASNNGFAYDRSALTEVVKLTERVIVDYKNILGDQENFANLIVILDQFANSGSEEAIELIWRLREAF